MDPNLALVIIAGIGALGGVSASIIAAWSATRSGKNGKALDTLVPTVARLEIHTNSMTETIRLLALKEGIQIGLDRGRATAEAEGIARAEGLKDGQSQPQMLAPASKSIGIGEIQLEDVESLKLRDAAVEKLNQAEK